MITVKVEIDNPEDDRVLVVSKDAEYDSTEQIWLSVWDSGTNVERRIVSEFVTTKGELLDALNELSVIEG